METKEYVLLKEYPFRKVGEILHTDCGCVLFKDKYGFCFGNEINQLIAEGWIKEVQKPLEVWVNVYKHKDDGSEYNGVYCSSTKDEAARTRDVKNYLRTAKFREVIDEETK
jgi:hypothetical protein